MDLHGNIVGNSILMSLLDPEETSEKIVSAAIENIPELHSAKDFVHIIGTGYGRNRVPFANDNVSEISCHAMGVHVVAPRVRTILDIGGQDVKGIRIDSEGFVKNFAMNDKCAAGTGKFLDNIVRAFGMSFDEFSEISMQSKKPLTITAQCTVFAESEIISLVGQKKSKADIAAGLLMSMSKRCYATLLKAGIENDVTITGGAAKNKGLIECFRKNLRTDIVSLSTDPQLMGALGAAEYARRAALVNN